MNTRRLFFAPRSFLPILVATLLGCHLSAADGPAVFAPIGFEQAREQALRENKPLLVLFTGSWEDACARLQQTVQADRKGRAFFAEQTVNVRVDVLGAPELTAKYHIRDVPLLLLLKPDGSEIDRWLGYQSANALMDGFKTALSGHPSVERLRAKVNPAKPKARRELATTLIARGSYADALTELRRLYEQMMVGKTPAQLKKNRNERRNVVRVLGAFARSDPSTAEFLKAKRAEHATAVVTSGYADAEMANSVVMLDTALDQPTETIVFFRSLPQTSGAYKQLKKLALPLIDEKSIFNIFVQERSYTEAAVLLSVDEHLNHVAGTKVYYSGLMKTVFRMVSPLHGGEILKFWYLEITRSVTASFELYAATKNQEVARRLAQNILRLDRSGQGASLIAASAKRALGDQSETFLRSLEIVGLPPIDKADNEPKGTDRPSELDENNEPVITLSPIIVTARSTGVVPLEVKAPLIQFQKGISAHLKIQLPSRNSIEALAPYKTGGWLVAVDGKSIKGQPWTWLEEFWREGGDTGTKVTLVLKSNGADDCVYREVVVKRVRSRAEN